MKEKHRKSGLICFIMDGAELTILMYHYLSVQGLFQQVELASHQM